MASMDELKKAAGIRAAEMIKDGMTVGLGTGSTAAHMVNRLAERIKTEGLHVTGVSTSWSTTLQCRSLGIPLKEMGEVAHLDMVIDGADEIDDQRNLIKGRGAAHLLEKIVASMTDNALTLDTCTYWFDGVLQQENACVLNVAERAYELGRGVDIKCHFTFQAEVIPERIYLACETPEIFSIKLNGKELADKLAH